MKRYVRASETLDEVLEIARTSTDTQELCDIVEENKKDAYDLMLIGESLAKNLKLPIDFIEHVISTDTWFYNDILYRIVRNPRVNISMLTKMVNSDNYHLRVAAAKSPYLDLNLMYKLSTDKHPSVNDALVHNTNLSRSLLRDVYDRKKNVMHSIIFNENTPLEILKAILNDEESDVDIRKAAREAIKRRIGKDLSKNHHHGSLFY